VIVAPYDGAADDWDRFAAAQPGFTHFHRHGWKSVLEDALGHECLYLVARTDDGTLAGVLPLVRVRSVLFGHFLVSVPFVNYGGPLGSDAAVRALVGHATELARRDGADLLELRSRRGLPLDLPVSHRKITVVRALPPGGPDALWTALDGKVRSQVRRPQKEGIAVRFGADQLEPFYRVFAHHMRDLGTPVQGRRLFAEVLARFGDDVWIGCAYHGDRPVAAGLGFRWGDEFEMTWASALSAYNRMSPNMLLYWSFLERAAREGLRIFNFGRCTPDGGTHKFKRQWGGQDEPLHWYQWTPAAAPASTPSPDDARYAWGPRLWRHLPVPIATWLGPRIVRLIP
jgi:FemAB-related protein (PEP-CTERM system-associated)